MWRGGDYQSESLNIIRNMKLACIDKSASARLSLQQQVVTALDSARAIYGHVNLFEVYVSQLVDMEYSASPRAVFIGSSFSVDESLHVCREVRRISPQTPIVVVLSEENLSLVSLQEFRLVSDAVLSVSDSPSRFMHAILEVTRTPKTTPGLVCVVDGVKGGVGATSVVCGVGHALQAVGKKALLVDLNRHSAIATYLGAEQLRSAKLAGALADNRTPSHELLVNCITDTPSGLSLLLPPTGYTESHEIWLHRSASVDFFLDAITVLRHHFDVLVFDIGGASGVVPFALIANADKRVLVSTNDYASIHLLASNLEEHFSMPGNAEVLVALNLIHQRGLSAGDISDYLAIRVPAIAKKLSYLTLPADKGAQSWIGSYNTPYTEGSRVMQEALCHLACRVANIPAEQRSGGIRGFLTHVISGLSRNTQSGATLVGSRRQLLPSVSTGDIRRDDTSSLSLLEPKESVAYKL